MQHLDWNSLDIVTFTSLKWQVMVHSLMVDSFVHIFRFQKVLMMKIL
jgi:hypothetical protein